MNMSGTIKMSLSRPGMTAGKPVRTGPLGDYTGTAINPEERI